jgi:uncharacterized protein
MSRPARAASKPEVALENRFLPLPDGNYPGMQNLTLLIKPSSHLCNLECAYCFYKRVSCIYPEKKPLMELETARTLVRKTLQLGCRENIFSWQGGEPTLMGIDFYRHVVEFQKQYATPGQVIGNSLQTNGTLIDEAWADFFAENHFFIGLSLDGPKDLHDHYRRTSSGKGTYEKVMQAVAFLKRHNVQFNILTLLTDANVLKPTELYRFFRKHGLPHLQFIPCHEIDPATGEELPFSISSEQLGTFYCKLFDLWLEDGFSDVSIRSFEDILIYYIDGVHVTCNWLEQCSSYLVIEHNGDVYPCDFFVYPEWKLGNIRKDPFQTIAANLRWQEFMTMKARLSRSCRDCRWLLFCHGDCPKFRTSDQGGLAGVSAFCSARRMLFEHMEPHLKSIKERALKARRQMEALATPARIARNDRCRCGSGLKYKRCCGRS